jgi:hypothetical protein
MIFRNRRVQLHPPCCVGQTVLSWNFIITIPKTMTMTAIGSTLQGLQGTRWNQGAVEFHREVCAVTTRS